MFELFIGVGMVTLRVRHAQTLKDRRKAAQSLVKRLRNAGFSVTESGDAENLRVACVGFSYAGKAAADVDAVFRQVDPLLLDFEVMEYHKETVDYTNPEEPVFSDSILDWRDPDDE